MRATQFEYKGRKVEVYQPSPRSYYYVRIDSEKLPDPRATKLTAESYAGRTVDEMTWEGFCNFNKSVGLECNSTREIYDEWCAVCEAENWK